jgi:predicted dehydrogenase
MITSLYGDKGGLVQKNLAGGYNFAAELYIEEAGNLYTKKLDRACAKAPTSYQEFISSIVEKREPLVKLDEALEVQQILDSLYASAAQGKEIVL